jgi:hypothetical protein
MAKLAVSTGSRQDGRAACCGLSQRLAFPAARAGHSLRGLPPRPAGHGAPAGQPAAAARAAVATVTGASRRPHCLRVALRGPACQRPWPQRGHSAAAVALNPRPPPSGPQPTCRPVPTTPGSELGEAAAP